MKTRARLLSLCLAAVALIAAMPARTPVRMAGQAPQIFDAFDRMDANNLDMAVTNRGSVARDYQTGGAGLVYPKGSGRTVVFAAGPWIGSRTNGTIRTAIGSYSQDFFQGTMQNGAPSPDDPRFRNWRIVRDSTSSFDFLDWPAVDGAPVDAAGTPVLSGDDMIWSVYNDADPSRHFGSGGEAVGIEVRQSTFAFNRPGALGNAIFLRFEIQNKGLEARDGVYFSFWADADLGGPADDLAGCDTTRNLGYVYNATNLDAQYATDPPAVGFDLLKGPGDLGMTSFNKWGGVPDPELPGEFYNDMAGFHADGTPIHEFDDPLAAVTTFQVSGDPVAGTGWLDSNPIDQKVLVSSGPFTMVPGETQEILVAVIVGQGSDRLSSITDLRAKDDLIQSLYDEGQLRFLRVTAPVHVTGSEGETLTFNVSADDPKGGPVDLSADGLPLGAQFENGTFLWTPDFNQAGDYSVVFVAASAASGFAEATTTIHVQNVNRAPEPNAGGPYTGFVNVPLTLEGGGSSDPDGDALQYDWHFGDGESGSGAQVLHAYASSGLYGVALAVSDGFLTEVATTTAFIVEVFDARAFTVAGNKTIRLAKGKPTWCVQIEPVGGSYDNTLVDLASLVMVSPGTGSVDRIPAVLGKNSIGVDRDGNGIAEITACFRKEDLQQLFANLHGTSSVPVTFEGTVVTGGTFRAAMDVGVAASGSALAASLSPNPLNPSASLSFITDRAGPLRVSLYDVSGRLVKTLVATDAAEEGLHTVAIDSKDGVGRPLASGIYFYRIESAGETSTGTAVILK